MVFLLIFPQFSNFPKCGNVSGNIVSRQINKVRWAVQAIGNAAMLMTHQIHTKAKLYETHGEKYTLAKLIAHIT